MGRSDQWAYLGDTPVAPGYLYGPRTLSRSTLSNCVSAVPVSTRTPSPTRQETITYRNGGSNALQFVTESIGCTRQAVPPTLELIPETSIAVYFHSQGLDPSPHPTKRGSWNIRGGGAQNEDSRPDLGV